MAQPNPSYAPSRTNKILTEIALFLWCFFLLLWADPKDTWAIIGVGATAGVSFAIVEFLYWFFLRLWQKASRGE